MSKRYLLYLLCCILPYLVLAQGLPFDMQPYSKEVQSVKNEGRFITTINNVPVKDKHGLMKEFSLQSQWWTLLAEPIEYYTIKWESTGQFEIDNKTITRRQLYKYPDLLKRFNNLRPYKIDIMIEGMGDAGRVVVKRGNSPKTFGFDTRKGFPFKKKGQAYDEYFLYSEFSYLVEDKKLLVTKAGRLGKGIVSGSPHWNEFFHWGNRNRWLKSDKNDAFLQNENKAKFDKVNKLTVVARLKKIEWDLTEMRSIVDLYEKYESGELEPSPVKKIEKQTKKEATQLNTYTKNDFWSKFEKKKEPELEIFFSGQLQGLRVKGTQKIIIPAKYSEINSYRNNELVERDKKKGLDNKNKYTIFLAKDPNRSYSQINYYHLYNSKGDLLLNGNYVDKVIIVSNTGTYTVRPGTSRKQVHTGSKVGFSIGIAKRRTGTWDAIGDFIFLDEHLKVIGKKTNVQVF